MDYSNIQELPSELKKAREAATLGDYQEADETYHLIMKKIEFKISRTVQIDQGLFFAWE